MPERDAASNSAPRWEYLLAHHTPERYHRTLRIDLGSRPLHVCARCTGQAVGFFGFLGALLSVPVLIGAIQAPVVLVAFALLPAPSALDWIRQSTRRHESTNRLRIATGALLGVAFGGLVALLASGELLFFLGGVGILGVYFAGLLVALRSGDAWRRVLNEHFPDLELPPEKE